MVKIRLSRVGRKNRPFYRIVVADSRRARDGRCIDYLGCFNPINKSNNELKINSERLAYWLSNGAQLSDRVAHLVKQLKKQSAVTA
jgi:small subunit ribosomal protein S16